MEKLTQTENFSAAPSEHHWSSTSAESWSAMSRQHNEGAVENKSTADKYLPSMENVLTGLTDSGPKTNDSQPKAVGSGSDSKSGSGVGSDTTKPESKSPQPQDGEVAPKPPEAKAKDSKDGISEEELAEIIDHLFPKTRNDRDALPPKVKAADTFEA